MSASSLAGLESRLRHHIRTMAAEIGVRHALRAGSLEAASTYIEEQLSGCGLEVRSQQFAAAGAVVRNLEAVMPGTNPALPAIVIGAHYDSVPGCAGANDNATGVAALLELAALLCDRSLVRTLRLVAFVNEEPPFFRTSAMGSLVYARALRAERRSVAGMLSLETIGYYDSRRGSQRYPPPFRILYPDQGDYIAFVANLRSMRLANEWARTFRRCCSFPSEWVAAPGWIPGLGWSDHWAFWHEGYPGVMATDTAPFRYPWYHSAGDTPDKIKFEEFTRVVEGIHAATARLTGT